MNNLPERNENKNGAYYSPSGAHSMDVDVHMQSLVEWLNHVLPHLNLPLEASEEELRACLIDGTVLCSVLNKLCPGLVEMRGNSEPGPENIRKFLAAMDEMGLPRFVLADIQQGYMVPVLQCLGTLKAHFENNGGEKNIHSRRRWNVSEIGFSEKIDDKNQSSLRSVKSESNIVELMKLNGLDNASTQTLFSLVNGVLDESIERKNGHVHHQMAYIVKKLVQVIEQRVSIQAVNLKDQNNLYKVQMEKYQSRVKVLETLAAGTAEEIQVLLSQLQQIKIEKTKIEEKKKLDEQDLFRIKQEKTHSDIENSKLKHELEIAKTTHEERCLLLQVQAEENKVQLEKKLKELESLLTESRKKVKDLESFSESKSQRWKRKEGTYQMFIDNQSRVFQELRSASGSLKHEILKIKRSYAEEFHFLGMKLKGLADAAANYHSVLAENRKLYNEVQDLKGNIRVYCRIRPFLPGQSKKQTTIEYVGENGELVVANPSKQGKDNHRLFKFNKVFGPTATQEAVFLDTQPLIRSVLDGYNVCIFAYGQTGSGKTYTMSGPNITSMEDWGVNYRALHDLFEISQNRKNSIDYEVGVQMVEIYNEQVRDLLSRDGPQRRLGIWNTAQPNGLAVPDASLHAVTSTADVLELMNIGLMNRAVGATALNERSSRSHSVLTIHVHGTDLETGTVLRGSLHLVDLAGSERVDRSEATGDRLREAQHINKSLSALGDVIFSLAQKSQHVPYRNSKLTQVLQSSLGGQAKTLMFVQLNPDTDSYLETISTLKFAERVSGVELGAAKSNKEGRNIKELMEQVALLKDTISKKDEEIEQLRLPKANVNGVKCGVNSHGYDSSSPRRHSSETPRQSPKLSGRKGSGLFEKVSSDMDNSSEFSERHSDGGSAQSVDDSRHQNMLPQSNSMDNLTLEKDSASWPKFIGTEVDQNDKEDLDLLGFGDADSDERLSDISDGCLSRAETDGSLGSAVEFTLFPESRSSDDAKPAAKAEKMKPSFASRLPKPPQKSAQTKVARLSLNKSCTPKASSSLSASRIRRPPPGSSSTAKPAKRWF